MGLTRTQERVFGLISSYNNEILPTNRELGEVLEKSSQAMASYIHSLQVRGYLKIIGRRDYIILYNDKGKEVARTKQKTKEEDKMSRKEALEEPFK